MLARSKLNRIESKISKALMDNELCYDDFETIINEEKNIENWKKALGWGIVKIEVILKNFNLIEEGKK